MVSRDAWEGVAQGRHAPAPGVAGRSREDGVVLPRTSHTFNLVQLFAKIELPVNLRRMIWIGHIYGFRNRAQADQVMQRLLI